MRLFISLLVLVFLIDSSKAVKDDVMRDIRNIGKLNVLKNIESEVEARRTKLKGDQKSLDMLESSFTQLRKTLYDNDEYDPSFDHFIILFMCCGKNPNFFGCHQSFKNLEQVLRDNKLTEEKLGLRNVEVNLHRKAYNALEIVRQTVKDNVERNFQAADLSLKNESQGAQREDKADAESRREALNMDYKKGMEILDFAEHHLTLHRLVVNYLRTNSDPCLGGCHRSFSGVKEALKNEGVDYLELFSPKKTSETSYMWGMVSSVTNYVMSFSLRKN